MSWLPLSFLSWPLAALAASIAIPGLVLLYLLKLRRRNLEISTTLLWKKAVQDLHANAPLQRLRRNIMLLLQLLVLALLILALAEPVMKSRSFTGQRHVILIDRSASMASTDAGANRSDETPRLAQAKKEALALVNSLREPGLLARATSITGDEAMVIAFDSAAEVRQSFTADKQKLRAAIESITQTDTPTRLSEAMRLAKAHSPRIVHAETDPNSTTPSETAASSAPVTIHLFSDGRITDAEQARPEPQDSFTFYKIGSDQSGNMGIVDVRAQRAYDDPNKLSIFVGLQNSEPAERSVEVELVVEGTVAGIKEITLPAARTGAASSTPSTAPTDPAPDTSPTSATPSSATPTTPEEHAPQVLEPGVGGVVFSLDREDALLAEVRLRPPPGSSGSLDSFATDNRVYVSAPPARRLRVGLVSAGSLFLSSALAGLPLAELRLLSPAEYQAMTARGEAPPVDVLILDGVLPPLTGSIATAGLPAGRFLILGEVPTIAPKDGALPPILDKGKSGNATIVDWQRTHPALRSITLDSVFIAESRDVEVRPGSAALSIARTEKGPAILELSSGPTRAIIVPFDVSATSWPLDVSFVVFLASAVDYLGGDAISGQSETTQMGATISQVLPAGATDIRLLPPPAAPGEEVIEETTLTPLPDGTVVFGPVRRTGVYRLTWKGARAPGDLEESGRNIRRIPANLLDPAESVIASTEKVALASRVVSASSDSAFKGDQRMWTWFFIACAALLMLEWYVYNRKVHI